MTRKHGLSVRCWSETGNSRSHDRERDWRDPHSTWSRNEFHDKQKGILGPDGNRRAVRCCCCKQRSKDGTKKRRFQNQQHWAGNDRSDSNSQGQRSLQEREWTFSQTKRVCSKKQTSRIRSSFQSAEAQRPGSEGNRYSARARW